MVREVAAALRRRKAASNEPSPLPGLPLHYGDYARWQRDWLRGEILGRRLEYWEQSLADAPPCNCRLIFPARPC